MGFWPLHAALNFLKGPLEGKVLNVTAAGATPSRLSSGGGSGTQAGAADGSAANRSQVAGNPATAHSGDGLAGAEVPAGQLSPLRELQLVELHTQGRAEATAELLQAYQRRIYSVCYRMVHDGEEARDLAQDAMVKLLEGLGSYDGRCRLSTWVIRVTMNCCLSHLRKRKLRRHGSLDESFEGDGPTAAQNLPARKELRFQGNVEHAEMRAILLAALETLDPDMRAVLVLRDMHDLDYQQISEVVGVPVGTVKSRLFRARTAVRSAAEEALGGGE